VAWVADYPELKLRCDPIEFKNILPFVEDEVNLAEGKKEEIKALRCKIPDKNWKGPPNLPSPVVNSVDEESDVESAANPNDTVWKEKWFETALERDDEKSKNAKLETKLGAEKEKVKNLRTESAT